MNTVTKTEIKSFPLVGRGKVRDIYDLHRYLLIVATDRLSAFDVVFDDPIPDKGQVLTGLSVYWFQETASDFPNHLVSADLETVPGLTGAERSLLQGRSLVVKKGQVIPVECVVRGYLAGSGWKEYQTSGTVNGTRLPKGLVESDRLPEPLFTPTTKEASGHDQPLTYAELEKRFGSELGVKLRDLSLGLFNRGAKRAEANGIIIADTKFEFAWVDGELTVVDEIFTPDSSRFWPADQYRPGGSQPSFDKQFVRDYVESLHWDKKPPAPRLPEEVIAKTSAKYREAYRLITGRSLTD